MKHGRGALRREKENLDPSLSLVPPMPKPPSPANATTRKKLVSALINGPASSLAVVEPANAVFTDPGPALEWIRWAESPKPFAYGAEWTKPVIVRESEEVQKCKDRAETCTRALVEWVTGKPSKIAKSSEHEQAALDAAQTRLITDRAGFMEDLARDWPSRAWNTGHDDLAIWAYRTVLAVHAALNDSEKAMAEQARWRWQSTLGNPAFIRRAAQYDLGRAGDGGGMALGPIGALAFAVLDERSSPGESLLQKEPWACALMALRSGTPTVGSFQAMWCSAVNGDGAKPALSVLGRSGVMEIPGMQEVIVGAIRAGWKAARVYLKSPGSCASIADRAMSCADALDVADRAAQAWIIARDYPASDLAAALTENKVVAARRWRALGANGLDIDPTPLLKLKSLKGGGRQVASEAQAEREREQLAAVIAQSVAPGEEPESKKAQQKSAMRL